MAAILALLKTNKAKLAPKVQKRGAICSTPSGTCTQPYCRAFETLHTQMRHVSWQLNKISGPLFACTCAMSLRNTSPLHQHSLSRPDIHRHNPSTAEIPLQQYSLSRTDIHCHNPSTAEIPPVTPNNTNSNRI